MCRSLWACVHFQISAIKRVAISAAILSAPSPFGVHVLRAKYQVDVWFVVLRNTRRCFSRSLAPKLVLLLLVTFCCFPLSPEAMFLTGTFASTAQN